MHKDIIAIVSNDDLKNIGSNIIKLNPVLLM